MQQTVCSAQVDECTEVCNVFDNAFYYITNVDSCKEFFLHFCFLCNQQLFTVADDSSSAWIELADHKLDFLTCIFAKISFVSIRYQACRDKYSCFVDHNAQTTIEYLCNRCFQYFVIFKSFFQSLVSFFCCQTFVSQQNLSFTIVYFQDFCFHFVVNMNNILEIYA